MNKSAAKIVALVEAEIKESIGITKVNLHDVLAAVAEIFELVRCEHCSELEECCELDDQGQCPSCQRDAAEQADIMAAQEGAYRQAKGF
jgi:hypothetical protein